MISTKHNNQGFTLVELLIVCPILMVVIAILMNFIFNQYGQLLVQNSAINLEVQSSGILSNIKKDIEPSNAFLKSTNAQLVDSFAPSGGWLANNSGSVLIISSAASTAKPESVDSQPVYVNKNGCSPENQKILNDILDYNIVYFVSGSKLYKRIVTNTTSSVCGSNYLKQTCPEEQYSIDCPKDIMLTDQLASFQVQYLDGSGQETDKPETATMVNITLKLRDKAYAENINAGSSLLVRKAKNE